MLAFPAMLSLGKLAARAVLGVALLGCLVSCRRSHGEAAPPDPEPRSAALSVTPEPPRPAVRVLVAYSSEKKAWLQEQIDLFNKTNPQLPSGTAFSIEGQAMGSGEAVQDILDAHLQPAVFSPASDAYLTLLNDAWLSSPGHGAPLAPCPGDDSQASLSSVR